MKLEDQACTPGQKQLDFGNYCTIEQKRHIGTNEHYIHKVIGQLESNGYVDVPVQSPATETVHDKVIPVVSCICCGVSETEVRKYPLHMVNPFEMRNSKK